MEDNFHVSHFEDYKVLAALFDRQNAGLAAANSTAELPPQFQRLRIVDNVTGSTQQSFDISTGIILDLSAPPDRLISEDLAVDFSNLEKAILTNLEERVKDIKKLSLSRRAKFFSLVSAIFQAESHLEEQILESYDGRHYASVHNNMGQLRRLAYEMMLKEGIYYDGTELTMKKLDDFEFGIFTLLKQAIVLALPRNLTGGSWSAPGIVNDPNFILDEYKIYKVSKMQATVLQSSYAQIAAVIARRATRMGKTLRNKKSGELFTDTVRAMMEREKMELETAASEYMRVSAAFGNSLAKECAVGLNPWAKLCGNMVKDSLISRCLG